MMIEPAVIKVGRGHVRSNAQQAFRLFGGCEQLRRTLIRKAVHTDTAIRGWMRAQPCNRFRAVAALVTKGIEISRRAATSAHILDDHMISVARKPHRVRVDHRRSNIAPVRLTHQQRRPWPFARGIVMIGNKRNPVTEPALDSAFQANSVSAVDQGHL